ncbi:MAG: DUF3794 domain-containing protein [Oscillospiraceae bacterium]|nr:DUF3794 domain-containing protein [Oscillospiraceae bacterium]
MEFKVNREEITALEVIFDDMQEQAVELDYVLPDYYPEIFKIIKCMSNPSILSYSVNGSRLTYEMSVCIRILYCSENSSTVHAVDQKLTYTKTAELSRTGINPRICIVPKLDYLNCRAVNQRRLDIRGAVSVKLKVTDLDKKDVVSDAFGCNIQLKKIPVTFPAGRLYTSKRFTVSEEFDLGMSKPPIVNILRSSAAVASNDKKVIANKLIAKGEVYINMLYSCQKDGADGIEAMQFTLPFSQIIDLEGIDENHICNVDTEVISCDIEPRSDGDGNAKVAECTLVLLVNCSAYRIATADLAVDEYSTSYKTVSEKSDIKVELPPVQVNSSCVAKAALDYNDGSIDCIHDVWCDIKDFTVRNDTENSQLSINGNALYSVMARNSEGMPVMLEKEEPFTAVIPSENLSEASYADIKIVPLSCSYNLASDNNVEAKAEMKITGELSNAVSINGITEIAVDESEPLNRNSNYALKLYFTDENEDLWEIAKKYGTSVSAIMEENEIEDDMISGSGMILIPIV